MTAKDALDESLLPKLEEHALRCGEKLDHLLGVLQGSLAASSHVTLDMMKHMGGTVDDCNVAVASAVMSMNHLLTKIQELSEEMKPVEDIANQVKDISSSLSLLEAAVAKLHKEKRRKEKEASNAKKKGLF